MPCINMHLSQKTQCSLGHWNTTTRHRSVQSFFDQFLELQRLLGRRHPIWWILDQLHFSTGGLQIGGGVLASAGCIERGDSLVTTLLQYQPVIPPDICCVSSEVFEPRLTAPWWHHYLAHVSPLPTPQKTCHNKSWPNLSSLEVFTSGSLAKANTSNHNFRGGGVRTGWNEISTKMKTRDESDGTQNRHNIQKSQIANRGNGCKTLRTFSLITCTNVETHKVVGTSCLHC